MASFNRVILAGNLTRDPDLRHVGNNTAVTEIGLAVNDKRKVNGEWRDEVTFVDITLWGRTAEVVCEHCNKGSNILVEGRLKLDTWEDKSGGGKRSKLRVVGERFQFLGSKGGGGGQRDNRYSESSQESETRQQAASADPQSEVPF